MIEELSKSQKQTSMPNIKKIQRPSTATGIKYIFYSKVDLMLIYDAIHSQNFLDFNDPFEKNIKNHLL